VDTDILTPAKRVVYLINTLDIGGAELGLLRLIDGGFFSASSEVSIVALSAGGGALVPFLEARAGTLSYSALTEESLTLARTLALVPRLYRRLRNLKPDVLMMSLPHANVVGRLAGKLARVPAIVAFEHNTRLRRDYLRPALRLTSPAVSAVLYDCEATRRAASNYYLRSSARPWHWVPLFTASSRPGTRTPRVTPPYRILTVARLERQKNLTPAIDAIRALRDDGLDVQYDIVGAGTLAPELANQIRHLGLQGAVRLVGFRAEWADLASRSDVYLQPSTWEGACLAALEAIQYGLPVIGTPTGGLVEYAQAGHCVWLSGGFTAAELATSIRTVLSQPTVRESLIQSGASYLEKEYSVIAVRDRYRTVAQSIGV
jgi:glycosyltransferase involved in cell wall biosynthesis